DGCRSHWRLHRGSTGRASPRRTRPRRPARASRRVELRASNAAPIRDPAPAALNERSSAAAFAAEASLDGMVGVVEYAGATKRATGVIATCCGRWALLGDSRGRVLRSGSRRLRRRRVRTAPLGRGPSWSDPFREVAGGRYPPQAALVS